MDKKVVELEVTDTGKGISSEYMRTSLFQRESKRIVSVDTTSDGPLFVAFSQEDPLASGTGLGLSIVRSIVTTLDGTIDVSSEIGKGTQIITRIPLSHLPGTNLTGSTASSIATDTSQESAIDILKKDYDQTTVALIGFRSVEQRLTLANYTTNWLGFEILADEAFTSGNVAGVCILDGTDWREFPQYSGGVTPTIMLCDDPSQSQRATQRHLGSFIEYVTKPVGPHKLAKALLSCLKKSRASNTGSAPAIAVSLEPTSAISEADTVTPNRSTSQLTLETYRGTKPLEVQTDGVVTACESTNAQHAVGSSEPFSSESKDAEGQAFPFPTQPSSNHDEGRGESQQSQNKDSTDKSFRTNDPVRKESRRPPLVSRMTEPIALARSEDDTTMAYFEGRIALPPRLRDGSMSVSIGVPQVWQEAGPSASAGAMLSKSNGTSATPKDGHRAPEPAKRPPRLLLVDDNKINLRLLETYIRKRKYQLIDMAENGQLAVEAAEAHRDGYDIIFMGAYSMLFVD